MRMTRSVCRHKHTHTHTLQPAGMPWMPEMHARARTHTHTVCSREHAAMLPLGPEILFAHCNKKESCEKTTDTHSYTHGSIFISMARAWKPPSCLKQYLFQLILFFSPTPPSPCCRVGAVESLLKCERQPQWSFSPSLSRSRL